METGLIAFVFFIVCAVSLTALGLGLRYLRAERKGQLERVLSIPHAAEQEPKETTILLAEQGSTADLQQAISQLPAFKKLEENIQQANMTWRAGWLLLAMVVLAVTGVLLGLRVPVPIFREFTIIALAGLLGSLPYALVMHNRRKRLAEFESQFPEALEFLARSMRAGHAFSVSLEMMSADAPDPLGIEFRQVFNEQNLGAPIETALTNLANRIPLVDVRFFVAAVMMQRDTGGNLAEILTKLASVIRERFRLKGQVKAVSAHGRITALVLSIMPVATMLALMVVAPTYLASMAADNDGKLLIIGAITGQLIGYIWMRKIINVKV